MKVDLDANFNQKSVDEEKHDDIISSFPSLVSHWLPSSPAPVPFFTSMIIHWLPPQLPYFEILEFRSAWKEFMEDYRADHLQFMERCSKYCQ